MFKTIVVPVDGSQSSVKAAATAADMANKYDSKVVLVHHLLRSMPPRDLKALAQAEGIGDKIKDELDRLEQTTSIPTPAMPNVQPTVPTETLQTIGQAVLEHAKRTVTAEGVKDANIETEFGDGDTAEGVVNVAKKRRADAIVMGTRGLSHVSAMFVGSVSHKITQMAPCSVIVVR